MRDDPNLDADIERLLAVPEYADHPLHDALTRLYAQYHDQLSQVERITRISDRYQSVAQQQALTMTERYRKQLRRLEKLARISDRYQEMMRDLNLALQEASSHDPLTGLANRRLMVERLRAEAGRHERLGRPFTLVMADIDNFKQVNDSYGHDVGDEVLVRVAKALNGDLRDYDLCCRWGGEEFLLLLSEVDVEGAEASVRRMRDAVSQIRLGADGQGPGLTMSMGMAEHKPGDNYSRTINRADSALLEAKRTGRDRYLIAA